MTAARVLDVSDLPPFEISSQAPLWWGQWCIVAIETTMFSILMAAYFYVRLRMDVWPPPGDQYPRLLLPTIALVPLILSAYGSYKASQGAKENDRRTMIVGMILNLAPALAFFVMRLFEWHSLNFNWRADAQGSYVWAFLGLYTFDYIADMTFTFVLLIIVLSGRYGEKQRLGVHVDTVVWYFLIVIWIPIYVVIYWGPWIVGTAQ
jgi:heme/copper-type cytochrome/quinol oxidase subunit 3